MKIGGYMRLSFINYLTGVKISSDMAALGAFVRDFELELNIGTDGKIDYKNAKIKNRDNTVKAGSNDVVQWPLNAHANYGILSPDGEDIDILNKHLFCLYIFNCLQQIYDELRNLSFQDLANKEKIMLLAQRLKSIENIATQLELYAREFGQQDKALKDRLIDKINQELRAIRIELNFLRGEIEKYKVERQQLLTTAAKTIASNSIIINDPLFKDVSGNDPVSIAKRQNIVKDLVEINLFVRGAKRQIAKLEDMNDKLNIQKDNLLLKLLAQSPPAAKSATNGASILHSQTNKIELKKLEISHPEVKAINKLIQNNDSQIRNLEKTITDVSSANNMVRIFQNQGVVISAPSPTSINTAMANIETVGMNAINTIEKKDELNENNIEKFESLKIQESIEVDNAQALGIDKSDLDLDDMLEDEPPKPRKNVI